MYLNSFFYNPIPAFHLVNTRKAINDTDLRTYKCRRKYQKFFSHTFCILLTYHEQDNERTLLNRVGILFNPILSYFFPSI